MHRLARQLYVLRRYLPLLLALLGSAPSHAQISTSEHEAQQLRLAKAASTANITLLEGLTGAEEFGRPVSGSFRKDEAGIRLIVHVRKGESVFRVVFKERNKKPQVTRVTDTHEYSDAYADSEGMSHATKSLRAALEDLQNAEPALVAIGVVPRSTGRQSSAEVTTFDGVAVRRISVPLR